MENRFEILYGYVQRSLVKNIRKELGDDESLTMGILTFNAYTESFYYESTVKNTLVFPCEIKKLFHEKEIWDMELMYYLGKYFTIRKTKGYIQDLVKENSKLVTYNASFYGIAFYEYEKFKSDWLDWLDALNGDRFQDPYDPQNNDLKIILNQLFHFGNYLLTIIKFNAYREGFTPDTGSFREQIYRVVVNAIVDSNRGLVNPQGELPPNDRGVTWYRQPDSLIKYSELALALEICFKQPFSVRNKINDLKAIIDDSESESEKFQLAAMAKALFYNGEFQGIIYITRNMEKGNFTIEDFDKFKRAISDFHIESIIHSSRFDTARILVEKTSTTDFQFHPVHKVLNAQNIFSSSPLGIVIIPEIANYIRFRDDRYMQTKKLTISTERIFDLFQKELDKSIKFLMQETNYLWIDVPAKHIARFNKTLTELFDITEELFINSFTCLKFYDNSKPIYYFLFNSNHIELLRPESSLAIKQSYALRTHNNVSKLIDAFLSSKNLSDIQNNLLNEIQLGIIHEQKSFLSSKIIKQIDEIEDLKPIKKIKKITRQIRLDTSNAIIRFGDYVKVLSEQSNEFDKSTISRKEIIEVCEKVKAKYKFKNVKILYDLSKLNDSDRIKSHLYTVSFLLDELVSNAIKQYSSPEGENIPEKEIEIRVKSAMSRDSSVGFDFEVFNTGTFISESIQEIAGLQRIANGSNDSTGFGFYFINKLLKRIMPPLVDGEKYFSIHNQVKGVGIKFSVYNKLSRK